MILDQFTEFVDDSGWLDRLPGPGERMDLPPLPGATPAALAASLLRGTEAPVVLVAPSPTDAEELDADLRSLAGEGVARYFPQRESLPHEDRDPHLEVEGERVDALAALLAGRTRLLITTARALAERTGVPAKGDSLFLRISEGDDWSRAELTDRLDEMGYTRVHTVSELGEYAVRGGIVDVFSFGFERPLRVELWGDEVSTMRRFDLLTQRSVEEVDEAELLPVELDSPGSSTERRSLLEILPSTTLYLETDPGEAADERRRLWEEIRDARSVSGGNGSKPAGLMPAEDLVLPAEEAEELVGGSRRLLVGEGAPGTPGGADDDAGIRPPPPVDRDMDRLVEVIEEGRERGDRVLVLCDNQGQLERLEEILEELAGARLARNTDLAIGSLSGGFRVGGPSPVLVLTDHEIFQRSRRIRRTNRRQGTSTLESVASLEPGDYVVHMDHGIGLFRGLERVDVGEEAIETLKIEYADGDVLRVPHYRLDLVERYTRVDDEDDQPRVHKLGGKRWKNLKKRTQESIQERAAELLELYAQRQMADGHDFSSDTRWQKEMEAAFLYDETPDQLEAWRDVKADMEEPRPMDRLLCGDVGYGKTEVAMRAAFKAVQDGKQVAVLAPTTVLVEQHFQTFTERLADFPVLIDHLSRFLTPSQQDEVVEGIEEGTVDIAVGTHRLLSDDVTFDDLGLLIVDEEQRFGVRQKEALKQAKRSVDVLTLTATPIPRTLQFALSGMRDLSLIETPPRDRLPIITHTLKWSDQILQDAMRRELDRGGQVFFVHDRVDSIDALAERVRGLVPDATVAVGHGQMRERELERVMKGLMEGDIDVLVCTTIIENGLDVPNANTMIVHRADRFGLAQLYQLRGRVGRSHRRAYCYLLVPPNVAPEAEDRLKVLEHHTELGSGYEVAKKDLQLRGAGNLLGTEQSGFAQAVGFDTYQRLLEKTVKKLKGEAGDGESTSRDVRVSVEGDAFLPDDYILDSEVKLHLYRRISRVEEAPEVDDLRDELRDRFGPLPGPARRLLEKVRLERLGGRLDLDYIRVSEDRARLNFREDALPPMKRLRNAFHDRQIDVDVRRTQPLSLVLERAGPEPLLPTLIDALELLRPDAADAGASPEPSSARAVSAS